MEHTSKIAFPGLGIGEFELSNVAFEIPDIFGIWGGSSFPVYWYGVIITLGMVIAFLYVIFRKVQSFYPILCIKSRRLP